MKKIKAPGSQKCVIYSVNMATIEIKKNAKLSIIFLKCNESLSNFASYSGSVNGKSYGYSRSVWSPLLTNIPQSLAYSLSTAWKSWNDELASEVLFWYSNEK